MPFHSNRIDTGNANGSSSGNYSGDDRDLRSSHDQYERPDSDLIDKPIYLLEHLATFTVNSESGIIYPADGMRRLLQLEKSTGIWSQKMQLCLDRQWVLIMDYETGVSGRSSFRILSPHTLGHRKTSILSIFTEYHRKISSIADKGANCIHKQWSDGIVQQYIGIYCGRWGRFAFRNAYFPSECAYSSCRRCDTIAILRLCSVHIAITSFPSLPIYLLFTL